MAKADYITLSGVDGFWTPFVNGAFGTEEDFGLIDEFSLNITEEELQHISRSCGSVGLADKVVVKKTDILADIVSPEISPKMIARAFKGKMTTVDVPAGTDVSGTVTMTALDMAYLIGARHLTKVVVKDSTDTTVYIEGTDYTVNFKTGELTAKTGGAITAGDDVKVTYDNDKYQSWTIAAFTEKAATGKLRLKACAVEGMDIEYTFEKITLKLNGSYSVVSAEEFASINLQGQVLADDTITDPSKSKLVNIRGDDLFV